MHIGHNLYDLAERRYGHGRCWWCSSIQYGSLINLWITPPLPKQLGNHLGEGNDGTLLPKAGGAEEAPGDRSAIFDLDVLRNSLRILPQSLSIRAQCQTVTWHLSPAKLTHFRRMRMTPIWTQNGQTPRTELYCRVPCVHSSNQKKDVCDAERHWKVPLLEMVG